MSFREHLINHYTHWIKITKNERHRAYAQTMLESVYNGNYKQQFKELGSHRSRFRHTESGRIYTSLQEAADAFGVRADTISINYKRYGLEKTAL